MKRAVTFGLLVSIIFICCAFTHTSPNFTITCPKFISAGGQALSLNYSLNSVRVGNLLGGKIGSVNFTLDAYGIDDNLTIPSPPTINPVITPTNISLQVLSGTKDINTAIYINGFEVILIDDQTTWTYEVSLSEGENQFIITAKNSYGFESDSIYSMILLDTSAPTTPIVTDDGVYTSSTTTLHATWTPADAETAIAEYQYAIATSAFGTDIVNWTSLPSAQTEITHTGLTLTQGEIYYISVKAKNAAGSWSEVGSSDGIIVNQNVPNIISIQPAGGTSRYIGDSIAFLVSADDADEDPLLYQFTLDGNIIRPWQSSPVFNLTTTGLSLGIHTMRVEVSDNSGGEVLQDIEFCLFRKPPAVPGN
ncbi:MAG: hypothetical protein ABH952_05690 [Candidatus Omnitrophota bacterium]